MVRVAEQPRSWIAPYYLSFDGIRAFAILAVFLCHFGYVGSAYIQPGLLWAGVDLFFVLSGFLITGILYQSAETPRYLRNFYLRRALRILPLYWGLLLAAGLIVPILQHRYVHQLWISLLFLQNLRLRPIFLHRAFNVTVIPLWRRYALELGPLWSLCVEEQFYALWPLCVLLIRSRQRLLKVCLWGAGAVLLLRCTLYALDPVARQTSYLYYQPYSRFDSLLIGAALNLWLRGRTLSREQVRRLSSWMFGTSVALLFLALRTIGRGKPIRETNPAIQTVGLTLVAVAAAALILRSLDEQSRFSRLLRTPPLRQLGKISYGFYFFHYLLLPFGLILATHLTGGAKILVLPIMFLACYAVADLSYRFWESPFLRLKRILAPADHESVPRGGQGCEPAVAGGTSSEADAMAM